MKILFSLDSFTSPHGGAEVSMISLARELAKRHFVKVLYTDKKNVKFEEYGCKLRAYKLHSLPMLSFINNIFRAELWKDILKKEIRDFKPDLVLTQLNLAAPTIDIASKFDVPTVLFIRDHRYFCFNDFTNGQNCNNNCWDCLSYMGKLQYPFFRKMMKNYRKALQGANLVVANSKYMANMIKEKCNVNAEVIYPFLKLEQYRVKEQRNQRYISFIGPNRGRGVEIALKIAKKMRNKEFLFLIWSWSKSTDKEEVKKQRNIKLFSRWTNNMRQVYSQTKLLIIPRIRPEPFGRIVVEAGANGIPSIASNKGGLPEAVGDGGILIDNFYNIDKWIKAIQSLENENLYAELSKRARENAKKFDFKNTYKQFSKCLEKNLNIKL